MKQDDPQFKLRLKPELKAKLEESAQANTRTLGAEIVARLEASYDADPSQLGKAVEMHATMAKTMAQFVVSAIDIAGATTPLTEKVFKLMRDTAEQVKSGQQPSMKGSMGELMLILMALERLPKGRDPKEFVDAVLRNYEEDKAARGIAPNPDRPHARKRVASARSMEAPLLSPKQMASLVNPTKPKP